MLFVNVRWKCMGLIKVEVAYARPSEQRILTVEIEENATIEKVIQQSGILTLFPEIDLRVVHVGIWSKKKKLTDRVQAGDRIEIYRPLIIDPKEARKNRVKNEIKIRLLSYD